MAPRVKVVNYTKRGYSGARSTEVVGTQPRDGQFAVPGRVIRRSPARRKARAGLPQEAMRSHPLVPREDGPLSLFQPLQYSVRQPAPTDPQSAEAAPELCCYLRMSKGVHILKKVAGLLERVLPALHQEGHMEEPAQLLPLGRADDPEPATNEPHETEAAGPAEQIQSTETAPPPDESGAFPEPSHRGADGSDPSSAQGARSATEVYGKGGLPTIESYDKKVKANTLSLAQLKEHNCNESLRAARLLKSDQHLMAVSRRQVSATSRSDNSPTGAGRIVTTSLVGLLSFLGACRVGGIPTCPTCGQAYRKPKDLASHLKEGPCVAIPWYDQGYEKLTERRFKCKFCQYESMRAHLVVAHSNLDLSCRRCLLDVMAGRFQGPQATGEPGEADASTPLIANDPLTMGYWTYSLEAAATVRAQQDLKRRRAARTRSTL